MSIYLGTKKLTTTTLPDNAVTTDTTQTITAGKTFTGYNQFKGHNMFSATDGQSMFEVSSDTNKCYFIDKNNSAKRMITMDPANNRIMSAQGSLTEQYGYTLPTKSGTIALTSDVSSLLQTFYDGIYPVGSHYVGVEKPHIPNGVTATWEKDNSVNGFYIQINNNVDPGTTGAEEATCENVVLTKDQMPKHSHNMQHHHNRGDMNITGYFAIAPSLSSQPNDSLPIKKASGAFYNAGSTGGTKAAICDIDSSYNRNWGASTVGFNANRSGAWTGLTSSTLNQFGTAITNTDVQGGNQSHKHKISGIEPRKVFAGLWKRTA